jgi:hypothetical protein
VSPGRPEPALALGRLHVLDDELIDEVAVVVLTEQLAQSLAQHLQIQMPSGDVGMAADITVGRPSRSLGAMLPQRPPHV